MGLTPVGFAHPVSQPAFILPDDFCRVIRTAAINDDVLQVGIVLIEHRQDGLLQVMSLVEGGGDDGDFGIVHFDKKSYKGCYSKITNE